MIYLTDWQKRWGVSDDALFELQQIFGINSPVIDNTGAVGDSESVVQQKVRYEAAQKGILLWRNNVGCLTDDRGIPVRYGLANESKKMNKLLKSSDLIGITPVLVRPDHVGTTMGIFTSYEVKHAGWQWTGAGREAAQKNWLDLVISRGGMGRFIS